MAKDDDILIEEILDSVSDDDALISSVLDQVAPTKAGTTSIQNQTGGMVERGVSNVRRFFRGRAEDVNQRRQSRPDLAKEALTDKSTSMEQQLGSMFGSFRLDLPKQLRGLGAIGQTAEQTVAGPIVGSAQKLQGVSPGEGPAEIGDIGRVAGNPEAASVAGGLTAASFITPGTASTNAARQLVLGKAAKATGNITKETARHISRDVFGHPDELFDYAEKRGYKFWTKENAKDTSPIGLLDQTAQMGEDFIYKPAHDAWEKLKPKLFKKPVDDSNLVLNIQDVLNKTISDPDPNVLNYMANLVKRIEARPATRARLKGKIKGEVPGAEDPGSPFAIEEGPLAKLAREMKQRADTEAAIADAPVTVGDLVTLKDMLAARGRSNPAYWRASTEVSQMLADTFDDLKQANELWQDWARFSAGLDVLGGSYEKSHVLGRRVIESSAKLSRIFDPSAGREIRETPEVLGKLLEKHSKGTVKADELATKMRDVVAAQAYRRGLPYLTFASISGAAGVAAFKLGLPPAVAGVGGVTAGLTGSQRFTAQLGKQLSTARTNLQRQKALQTRRILGAPVDVGITRQITGRNE